MLSSSKGKGDAANESKIPVFFQQLWIVLLVTASQASAQNEIELLIFNLGTGMLNSNSSS